jgi:hypothetical protein
MFKNTTVLFSEGKLYMIAYDLQCANGHTFEGWFEDAKAYSHQKKKSLISCPVCNVTTVSRLMSTFAIKKQSGQSAAADSSQVDLEKIGKKIASFVEENFDDVGCDFAKEALKIHYGASEARNIRGVSTKEEEKTLEAEGVQFFKFPLPVSSDSDS